MDAYDQRHVLGCSAVGILAGLVGNGLLDCVPTIKEMAVKLEQDWKATFNEDPKEAA